MSVQLAIGKMNRKVILRAPVQVDNSEGGIETSYPADTLVEFAFVREKSQFRVTEALVSSLSSVKEIYIRYSIASSAVDKDWQVEYDGELYMIHSIEKVEQKNMYLRLDLKNG